MLFLPVEPHRCTDPIGVCILAILTTHSSRPLATKSHHPVVGILVGPRLAVGREPGVASAVILTKGITAVTTLGGGRTAEASICLSETALRR